MSSSQPTTSGSIRSLWPWLAGAVVVLAIIAAFVVWGLTRPLHVIVDGVSRTVPARATLSDVQVSGVLNNRRGALLSLDGKVIRRDGGAAGVVKRNGRPVSMDDSLFDGDIVISRKGADITEARITRREALPLEVIQEGAGPVLALRRLGAPAVVEVISGKVSGIESTRSVVATGDPMVVVRRAPTSADKLVALTFDDGPWPGQTDKILAVLKKEGIHATFFMLGRAARNSPALARSVVEQGNLAGSHSLSHKELTKLKAPGIRKEISSGIAAVGAATGTRPVWFRPPYGASNGAVRKQERALGVKVAMWDIDTLDWTRPGPHTIFRNAVRSTKSGQIVLMHDGGGNRAETIEALPLVIGDLRSKGFTFVTLEEMAAAR